MTRAIRAVAIGATAGTLYVAAIALGTWAGVAWS